jgi:hypothetical protein
MLDDDVPDLAGILLVECTSRGLWVGEDGGLELAWLAERVKEVQQFRAHGSHYHVTPHIPVVFPGCVICALARITAAGVPDMWEQ